MINYMFIEDTELLKDNILEKACKIIYMKRSVKNYFIHIICCTFSNEETLRENWRELVNNVSEVIQKSLQKLIERYNVYIVFFQTNIDDTLIYEIEQNKYSSRKIVIKQEFPADKKQLVEIINSKLFDLSIEKDNKWNFCFWDEILQNDKAEIEQYITRRAWEIMDEKNK